MLQQEGLQSDSEAFLLSLEQEKSAFLLEIPKDYFSQFPQQMLSVIHAIEADEPSLAISKNNPFAVPENYFNQFLPELLNKINNETATVHFIDSLSRNNPFQLPENYFDQFEEALYEKVFHEEAISVAEEIKTLSPLLSNLKSKTTFEVPADYFEAPQKTIAFKNHAVRSIQWARWTAAAAILLIFGLGGFRFLNTSDTSNLQARKMSFEQALTQISDAEIQDYLDKTVNDFELASLTQNDDYDPGQQQVEANILKDVTNQEIKAYFEGK